MLGMQFEEHIYKKVLVNLHIVIFLKPIYEYINITPL